jgi:hypothetical protein
MGVRGLAIEPHMPVGVPEREIALTPVLILEITDFYAQALKARMLRIDIIDLNFDIHAWAGRR